MVTTETSPAWRIAAGLPDPELPIVTIADLGILRDVTEDDQGRVHVQITPTYSGCPAMETISEDLVDALTTAGYQHVDVEFVLSPAWTTDWMTDEARAKLTAYGVAPPTGHVGAGPVPLAAVRGAARSAAASTRGSPATSAPPPASPCGCAARAASPSTTSRRSDARCHPGRVPPPAGRGPRRADRGRDRRHLRGARRARATTTRFVHGQHLSIRGGDDVRRSYSLCTPPSSGVLRIGVKRLPGGAFSEGVLGRLRVGDTLEVMTPAGRFTTELDPTARKRYVAVAAGSGITPVLSIVAAILEGEPGSAVTLVYANRTHGSVMFLDEVHDLKDRFPERLQIVHVLSRETQDVELFSGRLDGPRLRAILDALAPADEVDDWFLCGPQQMVEELRAAIVDAGGAANRIHSELFHADPVRRAPVAALAGTEDGAARVTIRLDGRASELSLRPDGVPVLEAALRVRADLPFACRGGVCGTCRARVVEGSVAMDANYALEPEEVERGYVLTCQSHPTSERVVLDYDA